MKTQMKQQNPLSSPLTLSSSLIVGNKPTLLSALLPASLPALMLSSLMAVSAVNTAHADGEEDLSKYKNILANNVPASKPNNTTTANNKPAEKKPKPQPKTEPKPAKPKTKQETSATPETKPVTKPITKPKTEQAPQNKRIQLKPGEATIITPSVEKILEEEMPEPTFTELTHEPKESNLSSANRTLLAKNALLERNVNDLQTQVNVLVNERSGQLFMYGVYTAIASFLAGGFISYLIFGRRRNNW